MALTFLIAKNGSTACSFDGVLLHSKYNPEQESERFVESLAVSFIPHYVVVTEPALSYCAKFLRQRFPHARICAIRYDKSFAASDNLWDIVFNASNNLSNELFNTLGEEGICSTLFTSWKASERAYTLQHENAWHEIKKALEKSRDVLFTRSYFSSRWILNAISFCTRVWHAASLKKGTCPVVVAASGPSLESALPYLKKFRASFFLIAVSSALSVLAAHNIAPDICISTDGGFYARAHMLQFNTLLKKVPIALASEAACVRSLFTTSCFIPLSYGDGISSALLERCNIPAMHAERNGTVSGTAMQFAQNITDAPVFLCGLDMAPAPAFQHAQPNMLEQSASSCDSRISPKETRINAARFSSKSLELYRAWFQSLPDECVKNAFRLSQHFHYAHELGALHDVDFSFFEKARCPSPVMPRLTMQHIPCVEQRMSVAKSFIKEYAHSDAWLHEIFPAEYIAWQHADNEKERKWEQLQQKNETLIAKIERLLK